MLGGKDSALQWCEQVSRGLNVEARSDEQGLPWHRLLRLERLSLPTFLQVLIVTVVLVARFIARF